MRPALRSDESKARELSSLLVVTWRSLLLASVLTLPTSLRAADHGRTGRSLRSSGGVQYLLNRSWLAGAGTSIRGQAGGLSSLCTLALVNAGVPADDPAIKRALRSILRRSEPQRPIRSRCKRWLFAKSVRARTSAHPPQRAVAGTRRQVARPWRLDDTSACRWQRRWRSRRMRSLLSSLWGRPKIAASESSAGFEKAAAYWLANAEGQWRLGLRRRLCRPAV